MDVPLWRNVQIYVTLRCKGAPKRDRTAMHVSEHISQCLAVLSAFGVEYELVEGWDAEVTQ